MYEEYLRGEITAPSGPRHLEALIYALERLPGKTVVMRITCDTPGGPGAPRNFWNKSQLYQALEREMLRRNTRQGRLCGSFLAGHPDTPGPEYRFPDII